MAQLQRCAKAWTPPVRRTVSAMAAELGGRLVTITERTVVVAGLDEQHRYRMQHSLGYQVHDLDSVEHKVLSILGRPLRQAGRARAAPATRAAAG